MSEPNLFDNADIPPDEKEQLAREYHKGDRLDESQLIDTTVNQYISIILSAAIVVLIGHLIGELALLLFFGTLITIITLFGGKLLQLTDTSKRVTSDSTGATLDVWREFQNACNKQGVNPDDYLLLISDMKTGVAFAFPLSLNPSIVVSTNLLENCTPDELTSILSHELDHHKAGVFINFLFVYLNISLFAVGGAIMYFTQLTILQVFIVLTVYGLVTKALGNVVGHTLEKRADAAVSEENKLDFVRSLIKIQEESYHVEGKVGSIFHILFDEHPPLNHRIEQALGVELNSDAIDSSHLEGNISTSPLTLSLLGSLIGTVLVSIGIIETITTGLGADLTGTGGIILLVSRSIPDLAEEDIFRVSGGVLISILLGLIVGFLARPRAMGLIETFGWGIIAGLIGIIVFVVISGAVAILLPLASTGDNIDVPVMLSDPYKRGDGIREEDIDQSTISDFPKVDKDPSEITGDDVVIEDYDEEDTTREQED